ncbi:MAG: hypothetical protein EA352_02570 [Gemmatimonadales bacterium]|nr:MAG: hypothetical protein EA352_02570 [Gemmatimonadales bacterium]
MVQTNRNAVAIVAIIAIVVLVGIVAWFIREERSDNTIEIDFGMAALVGDPDVPALPMLPGA